MRESPRVRRLRTDHQVMLQLAKDSSILEFKATGDPPQKYLVRFKGKGFWRQDNSAATLVREEHEVSIELGASYPRMMPELLWKTPIFHPNISGSGVVCLGGYGTHWVPSLNLDELCEMLWEMIRYKNYDVTSPYNREAAAWAGAQRNFGLPIDPRPIRDRLAEDLAGKTTKKPSAVAASPRGEADSTADDDILIIDAEIVEEDSGGTATTDDGSSDILFLD